MLPTHTPAEEISAAEKATLLKQIGVYSNNENQAALDVDYAKELLGSKSKLRHDIALLHNRKTLLNKELLFNDKGLQLNKGLRFNKKLLLDKGLQLNKRLQRTKQVLRDKELLSKLQLDKFIKTLYAGIAEYESGHLNLVTNFLDKPAKGYPLTAARAELPPFSLRRHDPHFFRKLFIHFIDENIKPKQNNATYVNLALNNFLDKNKDSIFKLAFEEEIHSKAYRNALLRKSVLHFNKKRPEKLPGVLITNPSGCDNTEVTRKTLEKLFEHLQDDDNGFEIARIEDALVYETSQVMELAIQTANKHKHGYALIKDDLRAQTNGILDTIKSSMKAAVFAAETMGVAYVHTRDTELAELPVEFPKHLSPVLATVTGRSNASFQSDNAQFPFKKKYPDVTVITETDGVFKTDGERKLAEAKAYIEKLLKDLKAVNEKKTEARAKIEARAKTEALNKKEIKALLAINSDLHAIKELSVLLGQALAFMSRDIHEIYKKYWFENNIGRIDEERSFVHKIVRTFSPFKTITHIDDVKILSVIAFDKAIEALTLRVKEKNYLKDHSAVKPKPSILQELHPALIIQHTKVDMVRYMAELVLTGMALGIAIGVVAGILVAISLATGGIGTALLAGAVVFAGSMAAGAGMGLLVGTSRYLLGLVTHVNETEKVVTNPSSSPLPSINSENEMSVTEPKPSSLPSTDNKVNLALASAASKPKAEPNQNEVDEKKEALDDFLEPNSHNTNSPDNSDRSDSPSSNPDSPVSSVTKTETFFSTQKNGSSTSSSSSINDNDNYEATSKCGIA